ncbi:MAG TPA: hypothetical protein VM677_28180 [Actinokineospora sp.]|nr:hypothetical protein [Actinokineospora sp.]
MTAVNYDPDELDRAAQSLMRSHEALLTQAKAIRSAMQMQRFNGPSDQRFRREVETIANSVARQAEDISQRAKHLRSLAQNVRALGRH